MINPAFPSWRRSNPTTSRAAQKITLPCEIAGRFFPAADVDSFEFEAHKGEVWWVEVASERLGLPTDPFVLVQHVTQQGATEKLDDVAELNDIPSPVKVATYFYAYDGPPYNAGSLDVLGKVEIKEDGLHRLQVRDLFGENRSDPRHVYKLILRKAAPDFAVVAWAFHMELRNGDRNALSMPIALRGGGTMALEVVAVRRDGFDGPIELSMEDLPEGMIACGLKIPPGQNRGIMLITAAENCAALVGYRQDRRSGTDRWRTGEPPLPAGFDDLASAGLVAGDSLPAIARRRAGIDQWFREYTDQHRPGRKQVVGSSRLVASSPSL